MTDIPSNWHWGLGERGSAYYDKWFYTDAVLYPDGEFGWEGHLYWDDGSEHVVEFYQYTRMDPDGDHEMGYPEHVARFDSEDDAEQYAVEKARELRP